MAALVATNYKLSTGFPNISRNYITLNKELLER